MNTSSDLYEAKCNQILISRTHTGNTRLVEAHHYSFIQRRLAIEMDPREAADDFCLTGDSNDELADLEKEFALKRQKLLEEKARRKRERAKPQINVERSPLPPRKQSTVDYFTKGRVDPAKQPVRSEPEVKTVFTTHTKHKTQKETPNGFASRLAGMDRSKTNKLDYYARVFEFENVPKYTSIQVPPDDAETYSGIKLQTRLIPKEAVVELFEGIKILNVKRLLAKVTGPEFKEPSYANWCFVGMVVFMSKPKHTVKGQKYLILRVGDFDHSVDLMLFDAAFEKYCKLQVGEVIGVLNPQVKLFKGTFNLTLTDNSLSILELGRARHFGYCSSETKNGTRCKNFVDVSKLALCAYHEEQKYKASGLRMELQGVKMRESVYHRGNAHSNRRFDPDNWAGMGVYGGSRCEIFSGGTGFDEGKYDKPPSQASRARQKKTNSLLEKRLRATVAPKRVSELEKLGILRSGSDNETGNGGCETATCERRAGKHCGRETENQPNDGREKEGFHFHKTAAGVASATDNDNNGNGGKGLQKLILDMGFDPRDIDSSNASINNSGSVPRMSKNAHLQELKQLSRQKKVSLEPAQEQRRRQAAKWRQNAQLLLRNTQDGKSAPLKKLPQMDVNNEQRCYGSDGDDLEIVV